MSNSILSLSEKTSFEGIYKKETKRGLAYIARYTINKKTKTHIIAYEKDGMSEYDAFKLKLEIISSNKLSLALKSDNKEYLVSILFIKFMDSRKAYLASNTIANYKSIYNQYILKDFKDKDIRNITSNDLQKYINNLLSYRKPATVEKIVSAFKKFYLYLANKDIHRYNASSNLIMPKYDNKKYFSISKKDFNRIVHYISNIESLFYKTLYCLLLHGRRVNETITLRWTNIDFTSRIYYLNYEKTKTKKNQYYHLEDFQYEALKKLKQLYPTSTYVFENDKTKLPITYSSIFRVHKKLRIDLGMLDYTIHSLRHTVAYTIVNQGYPLEVVATLLGHSDIKSSSRYAVLEMSTAQKAYKKTLGFSLNKVLNDSNN